MLPNLIVIGAAECGTTSLHEYLDQHPAHAPRALRSAFTSEVEPPALPGVLREERERELHGEFDRLRAHTGLAFAGRST